MTRRSVQATSLSNLSALMNYFAANPVTSVSISCLRVMVSKTVSTPVMKDPQLVQRVSWLPMF